MFRLTFTSLLISLICLCACDKSKQILATFEYENRVVSVTRQELRWLLQLQNQKGGEIKATTQEQHSILKNYIFTQVLADKALEEKLQNKETYKDAMLLQKEKSDLTAYHIYLRGQDSSTSFDLIELQLIVLPNDSGEPLKKSKTSGEENNKEQNILPTQVATLIEELNSGKLSTQDIEEKVRNYSIHPNYRQQGGYIDPICTSCVAINSFDFMQKELEQAKVGKFFKVIKGNEIWVLRIIRKYSCDADDLLENHESFYRKVSQVARRWTSQKKETPLIQNNNRAQPLVISQEQIESLSSQKAKWLIKQQQRNHFAIKIKQLKSKQKFKPQAILEEIANIKTEAEYKKFIKKQKWGIDEVLYTLAEKPYTYGMFLQNYPSLANKKVGQQLYYLQKLIIPLAILNKDATFKALQKNQLSKFINNFIRKQALVVTFYKHTQSKIKISHQEGLAFYKTEKERRYNGLSYVKVKQRIENELKQIKISEQIKKIQTDLSKQYKLTIKNDLLDAENI